MNCIAQVTPHVVSLTAKRIDQVSDHVAMHGEVVNLFHERYKRPDLEDGSHECRDAIPGISHAKLFAHARERLARWSARKHMHVHPLVTRERIMHHAGMDVNLSCCLAEQRCADASSCWYLIAGHDAIEERQKAKRKSAHAAEEVAYSEARIWQAGITSRSPVNLARVADEHLSLRRLLEERRVVRIGGAV